MKHVEISSHKLEFCGLHIVEAKDEDKAGALRQFYRERPDVSANKNTNILIVCGTKAWLVVNKRSNAYTTPL